MMLGACRSDYVRFSRRRVQLVASFDSDVRCFATDLIKTSRGSERVTSTAQSDAIAYLQYTSGSTSDPKGHGDARECSGEPEIHRSPWWV